LPIRRQWKARNFETAQHIDKQKNTSFIYDKYAKNGTKLGGITPSEFDATYGEN